MMYNNNQNDILTLKYFITVTCKQLLANIRHEELKNLLLIIRLSFHLEKKNLN